MDVPHVLGKKILILWHKRNVSLAVLAETDGNSDGKEKNGTQFHN